MTVPYEKNNSQPGPPATLIGGESAGTTYDTGTVSLTANGHTTSHSYGQGDTGTSVAANLASAINNDSAAYVSASASGTIITLTSKTNGSSSNYSIVVGASSNQPTLFSAPSFALSVSGASLTGGASGGQVGGTAYVTAYSYDVLGNLLRRSSRAIPPTRPNGAPARLATIRSRSWSRLTTPNRAT